MEYKISELLSNFKALNFSSIIDGCSQAEFFLMLSIDECRHQAESEKVMVNMLAEKMNVSVPAVSKTLRNLDGKKLIKRITDVFCRRNTYVEFTAKGRKLLEKNMKAVNNLFETAFGEETGQKIESIINIVKDLKRAMEKGGNLDVSVK